MRLAELQAWNEHGKAGGDGGGRPGGSFRALITRAGFYYDGAVADITLIDPERTWQVDVETFQSKSVNSPFHGWTLQGRAVATIVGGRVKYRLGS